MEKKRSRSGLSYDEEEEYRRISTRKKRNIQYYEDGNGDDDVEEEDEDEEEEDDEEDAEQPGPSTQNTHNQTTQENRFLTVTCGSKKGILDKEKLKRGEECIKCNGRWYSPPAFEDFGGKRNCRKWKASILYKNEPLQCLFETGDLTTKGFKRKGAEPKKQKKIPSSNLILTLDSSSEDSEIHTAEETDEEIVKDEDWLPSSEDLVLEAEEERVEAENGGEVVDSDVDTSKEEDEMEEEEMEDEDVPSGGDNDSSVSEEREPKGVKSASLVTLKVVIEKLQFQATTDCQSNRMEPPLEDSWCKPLEDGEHNGSGIDKTAATDTDPSKMSDPPVAEGAEEENGEEFTQSNERKEDGHREIKAQTRNSPSPLSAPATSSPAIKPETEDIESTSNRTAILSSSSTDTGFLGDIKDVSPATKSKRVLDECKYQNRDATTSRRDAADLQVMQLETRIPQTTQASNITQSFNMVEAPSYRPSTSCDLDTMDLDQLRREKIKMQIKVLRLQEEYYALKIKGCKKI
ncbi:uncharacterized protein [Pagrus major]|uniref:uncharacterized protein n=1 Tax=Pagrus major TaxID=143350 RepID=UPI003CC8A86F